MNFGRIKLHFNFHILTLMVMVLAGSCEQALLSRRVDSTESKYYAQISSSKSSLGLGSETSISVFDRKDELVARSVLSTDDLFDSNFSEVYPVIEWRSNSVLRLGSDSDDIDTLEIINKTDTGIKYSLIETVGTKLLILNIEPKMAMKLNFRFNEMLSIDGAFDGSDRVVRTAVSVTENQSSPVPIGFTVTIDSDSATIISSSVSVKEIKCCGVDRPSPRE